MKKIFFAVLLLALPFLAGAQLLRPVKWDYSAKKTGTHQYELHMRAVIKPGWHVYAQKAGEGPVPTSFKFEGNKGVEMIGSVREEGKAKKMYDRNFQSVLKYYENTVDFVQTVKVKPGVKSVKGALEFMVCDNEQCLPPKTVDFEITL